MLKELYIRSPQDPNYKSNVIIAHEDLVEAIITRVRMILGTRNGDVLGSYDFGVNIEDYVFSTNFNARSIEEKINYQIATYVAPMAGDYSVSCKVSIGKNNTGYDYAIIDILINNKKMVGILVS